MPESVSPRPDDVPPAVAQAADPVHLLELFRRLLPAEALDGVATGNDTLFTPWLVIWLMVWQRSQCNASLSDAVAELYLGPTSHELPDCKRTREQNISMDTSGYSQGRSRLSTEVAGYAADHIFTALTADLAPAWNGQPTYLLDGSTLTLDHHPELVERFPSAVNQYGPSNWPVVRYVVAHELSTGFSPRWQWGPMYGPEATSETALARRLLPHLPARSLIVYDRNFGIFSMTWAAIRAGHDVVVRMTDSRFRAATKGMGSRAPGEWAGIWRPSRWDQKRNPDLPADAEVRGRFVKIGVVHEGRKVSLLLFTTDMTASHEELAALYRGRWGIETDIRNVKTILCMHSLRGRGVEMVEKEMLLGVVAYNLTLQLRRLAGERAGVPARELSFKRALGLSQAFARGMIGVSPESLPDRFERLLEAIGRCRILRRPGRSYPREVIPRSQGFPKRKTNPTVNKKS